MLDCNSAAKMGHGDISPGLPRPRQAATRAATGDGAGTDPWRIVGTSAALRAVLVDVDNVAPTKMPVLIMGETGTGKDLMARRLHRMSDRASGPWVRVDCTTLTPNLLEAELFGHMRGAFTGASEPRVGRVKLADGGTLFIDEIGELPLEQQGKFLRLIQDKEFEPVGSSRTIQVDVRVVAATNRDLHAEVAKGRFREDLYYRLAGFPILLPPLRDRPEDLPALVEYLLRQQTEQLRRPFVNPPASVIAALQRHHWPGNIRELRAAIERACIRSKGRALAREDFELVPAATASLRSAGPYEPKPRARTLREVEREHLQAMLTLSGGIIEGSSGAAVLLGLPPSTLRFRMRRLGILPAAPHRPPSERVGRNDYVFTPTREATATHG